MLTAADTAFSIAFVRAEESEKPAEARLFEDPFAALFHRGGAEAWEGTERFLALPIFRELVRLRTRFLDDFVRDGLAAGLRQVVLLGAGFDCRGLRMPEIPAHEASVFEVDFDAQLEKKRALLAAGGVMMPSWVAQIGCDFGAPEFDVGLEGGLVERGFRRGAGALFVWEGVLGYIDDAAIDRSLAFMARFGGSGTRVSFDYNDLRFDPEPVDTRMRRAGFTAFEAFQHTDLWRRHFRAEPHPAAEIWRMGVASV